MSDQLAYPTYESLGVRPCQLPGNVHHYQRLADFARSAQANVEASSNTSTSTSCWKAVGARIGELMQCEWGKLPIGCAAACVPSTAACVAGTDTETMARSRATGIEKPVIVQPATATGTITPCAWSASK